jgi:hypothetical protein
MSAAEGAASCADRTVVTSASAAPAHDARMNMDLFPKARLNR